MSATAADAPPIQRADARFVIDLHPSKAGALAEGVREHLNSLLLRWNDDLEAVVLGYSGERITSREARVCYWYPLIRVEARAEVVLLRPRAGHTMEGVVNKVGADYLGLLVAGVFNCAIPRADVRPEFRPNHAGDAWVSSKDAGHVLSEGCTLRFVVTGVEAQGFFTLRGALRERWTGNVEHVPQPPSAPGAAALGGEGSSKKKKKGEGEEQTGVRQGTGGEGGGSGKKRDKKRRRDGADVDSARKKDKKSSKKHKA